MTTGAHARDRVAAVLLVAAVYVFFLLFAQFGFLQGIRAGGRGVSDIHRVLAAMAVAGITASLIAPRSVAARGAARTTAIGLAFGAVGAAIAGGLFARHDASSGSLIAVALLTGAGLGFATVGLASDIRRLTHARAIALHVGAGTGLAYFFCNVPDVFVATPAAKAWISAAFAAAGVAIAMVARARPAASLRERVAEPAAPRDLASALTAPRGIACVTGAFLALVWFDSAAFAVVQMTPALRAGLWSGPGALWTNAAVHAVAALAAGAALDRGWFRAVLVVALALLAGATWLFQDAHQVATLAGPLYVAGVSFYSTALAAFAALAPARESQPAPAWRAALVYAVAGWAGSAAGVGLAEQVGALPRWAALAAAAVLAGALVSVRRGRPSEYAIDPSR